MYKSNREKKDTSFWGRKDIFYNTVQFDKNKAIEYFHTLHLDKSETCLFIEQFITFYLQHKINNNNAYWFKQSLDFINEVISVNYDMLYKFTIEHIGQFEKKEDFEIFYYFKSLDILQQGYNNIYSEVLNWLSYNEQNINKLSDKYNEEQTQLSNYFLMGTKGVGKSLYVKQHLLQDGFIVISQKNMNLKSFYEDDKEYFYQLLINLTPEQTIDNLLTKIEENLNNSELKGIASYIEKRIKFECLSKKMSLKQINATCKKHKTLKI